MSTLGHMRGKDCYLNWNYWVGTNSASSATSPSITFRANSPDQMRIINSCFICNTATDSSCKISVFLASDTSTNRREIPIVWDLILPVGMTFTLATKDSPIILYNESNNNQKAFPGYENNNSSIQDWGWVPQELCIYNDGNGTFDTMFFWQGWS